MMPLGLAVGVTAGCVCLPLTLCHTDRMRSFVTVIVMVDGFREIEARSSDSNNDLLGYTR